MEKIDLIYLGNKIKNPDKYINKLVNGKSLKKFYIVAFENEKTKPEIISSYMFFQKYFRNQKYLIIAIVNDETEAFEYIKNLTQLSLNKYNLIDYVKTIESLTNDDMNIFYETEEETR